MTTASCSDFTVEIPDRFPAVRTFGASVSARSVPESLTSPQMSVWTDVADDRPIADTLTEITTDLGRIVERRPIEVAGLTGEFVHCLDTLKDFETGKKVRWHRLRVMAEGLSAGGRFHATAMCSHGDLAEVTTAFQSLLDSLTLRIGAPGATAAHAKESEEADAMLQAVVARFEAAANAVRAQAELDAARGLVGPVADVETRFGAALRVAGVAHLTERLRPLAVPALALLEGEDADGTGTGLTRIGDGPDLAEDEPWPRDDSGLHLNFLAQVNLADLPRGASHLPKDGILSFFSGTDLHEGRVLYTPAGARLVRHSLPDDAQDIALAVARMVTWNPDADRFALTTRRVDGFTGETERDGRIRVLRDGAPVIALSSEYEISLSSRALRIEPTLALPFADERYAAEGVDDPFEIWQAVREGMALGDGPQHQMFGLVGSEDQGGASPIGRAIERATTLGWADLAAEPQGWFVLLALRSGGNVGFEFWDHGSVVYLAHAADLARADVSRVVMVIDSS